VKDLVKVNLTQSQFDALVSFVFNGGRENFRTSTLLKLINGEKFDQVPAEFRKWVYSKGKHMQGLVNRREAEIKLFTSK